MIIWLTGNSGNGKTTLATALRERLHNYIILDGDVMRRSISLGAGFTKEAREEHNLRIARLAKELEAQGHNVLVSVIAPFRSTRAKIDEIVKVNWVWIDRIPDKSIEYPYEPPENALHLKNMTIDDEVKATIEGLRLFNVFVFGLPRSGTSMMMGIIERLGVKVIQTSDIEEELEKRNENERKRYGDKYQMNPDGFYEITKDAWKYYDQIINTHYSGCKMIIPVRPDRFRIVSAKPFTKVIQMWRDPEEIRQSQQASYDGNKGITEEEAEFKRATIRTQLIDQKIFLNKRKIDTLHIQYRDVLKDTNNIIKQIADFIKAPNSVDEAIRWVRPEKNRFKIEKLEVGI